MRCVKNKELKGIGYKDLPNKTKTHLAAVGQRVFIVHDSQYVFATVCEHIEEKGR